MKNSIYLRRSRKLILATGTSSSANKPYIATIMKNFEECGFILSPKLIEVLKTYSKQELGDFYLNIYGSIKEMLGFHREYRVMYPNFPQQVMSMSSCELYFNSFVHYLSNGTLLPASETENRLPLVQSTSLSMIDLGDEKDFINTFVKLINAKGSISAADKEDLKWFFTEYKEKALKALPSKIEFKENSALVMAAIVKAGLGERIDLSQYLVTATDILRFAVALSDGDISLASSTKFISFKRKQRRDLLSLLECCANLQEDMLRYKKRFIRLGERLHPSEYKELYPKAELAFSKLRNNVKITTFNSDIEQAIQANNLIKALELLRTRPGEYARKLDYLLRTFPNNTKKILKGFNLVGSHVSIPVLLQVKEHFANRNKKNDLRTFFPKANVAKAYGIVNNMLPISEKACEQVVDICENVLITLFKSRENLGKVYIDKNLKNYIVPFSQRSASKSLKSFSRGSKITLPNNCNTLRSFLYWKQNKQERTDIDLAAVFYNRDWVYIDHISYTNLKSETYNAVHSGDIVAAPNGASEFIDINLPKLNQCGVSYIVFDVLMYTSQSFIELPECFMGYMSREEAEAGEIFEPKTVLNKIDITADTSICIPMILDVANRQIIWCDLALKNHPSFVNNIESNNKGIALMGKAMLNVVKPNLYDLFALHAKARGELCSSKEEADIIFSLTEGITPFNTQTILSSFL